MADFPTDLSNVQDNTTDVLAKHINNLEAKVGINSSADANSLDYKVAQNTTALGGKISHSLATAVSDFLVSSGAGVFIKKTLAEVKTILGLGSAAYTASTDYATAGHNHSGVYAPVLGADDNYVTDAEKTKLANLSGTNTGDQTLPVKAIGTELDTGTDDAKFATAKALADSGYKKNPMTAAGDLIYGGTGGAPTRLAKGTAAQVLKMNAGATAPEWGDAGSGATAGKNFIPFPASCQLISAGDNATIDAPANLTTMWVGKILVPVPITLATLKFWAVTGTSSTLKIALFSEDGQTRLFSVTSASLSASQDVNSASVGNVLIPAGLYYIAIIGQVGTVGVWNTSAATRGSSLARISTTPYEGTYTVTSDTMPSTITIGNITWSQNKTLYCSFVA